MNLKSTIDGVLMNPKNDDNVVSTKIFDAFQRIYIVNLPSRSDRRQAILSDLANAGIVAEDPRLRIFPGVRPADAGEFPSLGARGCYMSHLSVLQEALANGLENVLILEDDLALEPAARLPQPQLVAMLREGDWDFAYPGHVEGSGDLTAAQPAWHITDQPLVCAHFLGLNRRVLPTLVDYLETCLERPAGHPDGGPMHVDGAYTMFRQRNPKVVTLICMPSLGGQRSSRSDIYFNRWFDRLPVFREAVGVVRVAINYLRSLRQGCAAIRRQ
jgi:hypothetical protein